MSKAGLTDTEWAVICTIRQEPNYRFLYNEAKIAKRMEAKGLLKSIGNKRYEVTDKAKALYEPMTPKRNVVATITLQPKG